MSRRKYPETRAEMQAELARAKEEARQLENQEKQ